MTDLLMELKHYSIIEYNILRRAECTFPQENILRMTVEDNAVFREKTSELKRILEKVFHERCGLPVDVIYEYIPVKENQESRQRETQIQREINDRLVALADKLGDGADAAVPVKKEETAHSAGLQGLEMAGTQHQRSRPHQEVQEPEHRRHLAPMGVASGRSHFPETGNSAAAIRKKATTRMCCMAVILMMSLSASVTLRERWVKSLSVVRSSTPTAVC